MIRQDSPQKQEFELNGAFQERFSSTAGLARDGNNMILWITEQGRRIDDVRREHRGEMSLKFCSAKILHAQHLPGKRRDTSVTWPIMFKLQLPNEQHIGFEKLARGCDIRRIRQVGRSPLHSIRWPSLQGQLFLHFPSICLFKGAAARVKKTYLSSSPLEDSSFNLRRTQLGYL